MLAECFKTVKFTFIISKLEKDQSLFTKDKLKLDMVMHERETFALVFGSVILLEKE